MTIVPQSRVSIFLGLAFAAVAALGSLGVWLWPSSGGNPPPPPPTTQFSLSPTTTNFTSGSPTASASESSGKTAYIRNIDSLCEEAKSQISDQGPPPSEPRGRSAWRYDVTQTLKNEVLNPWQRVSTPSGDSGRIHDMQAKLGGFIQAADVASQYYEQGDVANGDLAASQSMIVYGQFAQAAADYGMEVCPNVSP